MQSFKDAMLIDNIDTTRWPIIGIRLRSLATSQDIQDY